ncbi:Small ribosomal subunit protein bS20c-like protein [Drosera capensis]
MVASAMHYCLAITSRFKSLSIRPQSSSSQSHFGPLGSLRFSSNLSHNTFSNAPKGKANSSEKRRGQAEKSRLRNKSRKSEARTRMKKVFANLVVLRKKKDAQSEEILSIEKLISEAYAAIDKAGARTQGHGGNLGLLEKRRPWRSIIPAAPAIAATDVAAPAVAAV